MFLCEHLSMHHGTISYGQHQQRSGFGLRAPELSMVSTLGGRTLALGFCNEYPVVESRGFLPAHASINHSIPRWETITMDKKHQPPQRKSFLKEHQV